MTEQEYKEMIYKKAEAVKTETDLSALLKEITEYKHDYGTIVYGVMAAMTGAFKVVNDSPNGGITGFQASCLGWECIRKFMMVEGPLRIMDFNNMLYPQYQDSFEKVMPIDTWEKLKEKAQERLKEEIHANTKVKAHWQSIADGKIPFGWETKAE